MEVLFNEDAFTAYVEGGSAIFSFEKPKSALDVTRPSSPVEKASSENTLGDIAKWGEDNLFPQNVYSECSKVSFISSVLERKAEMLFSGGVVVGKVLDYDDNGQEIFKPETYAAWEAFKRKSNVDRYLIEAAKDLYWFYNVFPEIVLSKDRKQIVSICTQEAMFCRWEKQNKTGLSANCYINANWDKNPGVDPKNGTIKVPTIDPYYDAAGVLKEDTRGLKYIYPLSYSSPGRVLYQLASWDSIRESGWLDVAVSIPKFKKALMKNQVTIKYHVRIPDYFWKWKFKDWDSKAPKVQAELKSEEIKKFTEFLSGEEKAGKVFISSYRFDDVNNKQYPGWEILPIDDKLKDGAYLEDSQEASSHILFSLGFHSAFLGDAPGKGGGQGAGSGSDIREAINMHMSFIEPHARLILEPLNLIRDYNGWDAELEFRFKRPFMQTLNQVSPSKRETKQNGTV